MSTDKTEQAPNVWRELYRRAINEANGLTNYVEDRPELRSAEKRLAKIEEDARAALTAAPPAQQQQSEPPNGWKLVPVEPTREMAMAGLEFTAFPRSAYSAMIAAATGGTSLLWVRGLTSAVTGLRPHRSNDERHPCRRKSG